MPHDLVKSKGRSLRKDSGSLFTNFVNDFRKDCSTWKTNPPRGSSIPSPRRWVIELENLLLQLGFLIDLVERAKAGGGTAAEATPPAGGKKPVPA